MDATLYDWAGEAAGALDLPEEARWVADRLTVTWALDLARDIAHGEARPAAPVGTFLAGVAIGLAGAQERQLLEATRGRLVQILSSPPDTRPDRPGE